MGQSALQDKLGHYLQFLFIDFGCFRLAARGARWLNPIVMSIAIRIMGLLLAAVAIQFMLNAIRAFRLDLLPIPAL